MTAVPPLLMRPLSAAAGTLPPSQLAASIQLPSPVLLEKTSTASAAGAKMEAAPRAKSPPKLARTLRADRCPPGCPVVIGLFSSRRTEVTGGLYKTSVVKHQKKVRARLRGFALRVGTQVVAGVRAARGGAPSLVRSRGPGMV